MVITAFQFEDFLQDVFFEGLAACLHVQTERLIAGGSVLLQLLGVVDGAWLPVTLRELLVKTLDGVNVPCNWAVSKVVHTAQVRVLVLRTLVEAGHISKFKL